MKTTSNIQEAYASVREFNDVAGNLTNVTIESIDAQLGFIFEELSETIDGLEGLDKVELLDGACDLFVTVSGLMQKLEAAGYDVARALHRVNANNLSKFPPAGVPISATEGQEITFNDKYSRFVFKNKVGKIMKPPGFKSVCLQDLVPA